MALMSTTLIILFGMVVGVGHLTQAKMNLQNAVDLASMSGASLQARYLNQISLINYRLRQNYKFILYDLYLVQSRFNKSFKDRVLKSGGPFDRLDSDTTAFGICQQQRGFCGGRIGDKPGCISDTTDICQNVGETYKAIPPITPSPIVSLNPILLAINASIVQLGEAAKEFCEAAKDQNKKYFEYIMENYEDRQRYQMEQLVKALQDFNQVFSSGTEITGSGAMGDATIYSTFVQNLISANRDGEMIKLEWLGDPKSRTYADTQISQLQNTIFNGQSPSQNFSDYWDRQKVSFKIRYIDFEVSGSGCRPNPVDATFQGKGGGGTFLGLSRARTGMTGPVKIPFSVALRATVRPNLLFWPQGFTPTLVAVGAAKPFGSRIGPSARQTEIETVGSNGNKAALANMSFYPGDNPRDVDGNKLPGMGHTHILKRLLQELPNPDMGTNDLRPSMNSSPNCSSGSPDFMCMVLAPTLYEGFFWNAFPYSPGGIEEAFTKIFGGVGLALSQTFPREGQFGSPNSNVAGGAYTMKDRNGRGENPAWHATTYIGDKFAVGGKAAFFADKHSGLSSWSPSLNPASFVNTDTLSHGRMGYSIKLVSLNEICSEINEGGSASIPSPLSSYCDSSEGVFH